VQAKLLRVLESREVLALGALKSQPVTLRVVSASHRSLYGEVAAGRLREDLYYRIGRPAERVPSLRERPEEIPWLVDCELKRSNPNLSAHVSLIEACMLRSWPGNVRELLVEVRSAGQEAIARDSQRVKAEHLSGNAGLALAAQSAMSPPTNTSSGQHAVPAPMKPAPPAAREDDAARADQQRPNRSAILAALIDAKGNISAAARALGVHRTHLRRHIEFHGIDVDRLRALKT
jgi:DNA-binding NtrC family response regulator